MKFLLKSNLSYTIMGFLIATPGIGQDIWPFRNTSNNVLRGSINGTAGEFRAQGAGVRFHAGVDFTSPLTDNPGTAVFSMHSGAVHVENSGNCWTSHIRIRTADGRYIYYKHIIPSKVNPVTGGTVIELQNSNPPQAVNVGTFLGTMTTIGGCPQHVHINDNPNEGDEFTGTTNFINNFVHPFSDNVAPDFITPFNANGAIVGENSIDAAEFWRNGKTYATASTQLNKVTNINGVDQTIVYSKVDIISRIRDRGINDTGGSNGGNNGINSVNLQIINSSNVAVGQEISNINFNTVPPNDRAQFLFDSRSVLGTGNTESRHVYILTSSVIGNPPYDRFWNTGLREGQTEDWVLNNRGDKDARSIR